MSDDVADGPALSRSEATTMRAMMVSGILLMLAILIFPRLLEE